MKYILNCMVSFLFISNLAFASDEWIQEPEGKCADYLLLNKLESKDVSEVTHSKFLAAKSKLKNSPIIKINSDLVGFYTGLKLGVNDGEKLYLVRAVFGNGGTGGFSVFTCGDDLLVSHHSLGNASSPKKTALIVRLPVLPHNVYVKFSSYK